MASIKISELHPAGSDLFQDSESFLNELTEDELGLEGGGDKTKIKIKIKSIAITVISVNGNTINANTYGTGNTAI